MSQLSGMNAIQGCAVDYRNDRYSKLRCFIFLKNKTYNEKKHRNIHRL